MQYARRNCSQSVSGVAALADISVESLRELIIFVIRKAFLWVEGFQKYFIKIWGKKIHC